MSDILDDLIRNWNKFKLTKIYYTTSNYIPKANRDGEPFILHLSKRNVFLFHPDVLPVLKEELPGCEFVEFDWNQNARDDFDFKMRVRTKTDFGENK